MFVLHLRMSVHLWDIVLDTPLFCAIEFQFLALELTKYLFVTIEFLAFLFS
jgi:hypothetical protein